MKEVYNKLYLVDDIEVIRCILTSSAYSVWNLHHLTFVTE